MLKYLFLRLFKIAAMLHAVIYLFAGREMKTMGIFRRMSDAYEEACFSEENIYKLDKHGLATSSLNRKDSSWRENTLTLR